MKLILPLASLILAACNHEPAPSAPPPVPPPMVVVPPGAPPADAAVVAPSAAPRRVPPTDLPAFTTKRASKEDWLDAGGLVQQAWRAEELPTDRDPVDLAIAAVRKDPSRPEARAALACLIGDPAFALAQMTPVAMAKDCVDCADTVRDLATYGCVDSPAVKALADQVKPTPQRAAAEALIATLRDGDPAHAAAYFHAPKVDLVEVCGLCDNTPPTHDVGAGAAQLAKLVTQVKEANTKQIGEVLVGYGLACTATCCHPSFASARHNTQQLTAVCFKPGTDQIDHVEIAGE